MTALRICLALTLAALPLPAIAQETAGSATATATVDDQAALEAVNAEWLNAYKTKDRQALERVLADEFVGIYNGRPVTKTQLIASATAADRNVTSVTWEGLDIRLFGDIAMATGRLTLKATQGTRETVSSSHYADVYRKIGGQWRAIAAHVVRATP